MSPSVEHRRSIGMRFMLLLLILAVVTGVSSLHAQTREVLKQQAESQLQQMTPEQIEAKIKEYGMTREQAEEKAGELGIDLSTYLQQQSAVALPAQKAETVVPGEETKTGADAGTEKEKEAAAAKKPASGTTGAGPGGLPFFGYSIFSEVPAAFEPSAIGPADPEYIIGPGDVLKVSVWGQVEFQNELTVDKEGRIFIPTVGQVLVSGQSLDITYSKLKAQMSRSYSGLVSRPPTVWMDLTISKLRPKRIFMMGEVAKPGGYTVSSYATVFNSLYSIGGPTVQGSLRDVRVIRDEKVIAHVDLYKYLTGAEETDDIRVQNNDIVFIPPRGKTVAISKQVRQPAIYELLPAENLKQLLDYSGGALATAYLERVQIDRIIPFKERRPGGPERRIIDINFREILNQNGDYELVDGDRVSVYSIFDERKNYVRVTGAVMRPGMFQLEKAPSVKSLIAAAEGLTAAVYTEVAHIVRYNDDMITKRLLPFNLKELLADPQKDIALEPRDELIVYSTEAIKVTNKFVTVFGEVKVPGQYPLRDNMTLDDLILLAGGYTEEAEKDKAEISRLKPNALTHDTLSIILHPELPEVVKSMGRNEKGDTVEMLSLVSREYFPLQHRDEILIRPDPEYKLQQNVTITGDVPYPGVYAWRSGGSPSRIF